MLGVTILGNNSALPAYERHPTAQVVTLNEQLLLLDCGEGTQLQLNRYKVRRSRINRILISHLHGDHYFGLVGLITSMGLLGREQALHLHAPAPLEQIIRLQLEAAGIGLPFPLHFHPLEKEGLLVDEAKYSIACFPVYHRIECWGFIIREKKKPRKIDREKAMAHGVPAQYYERLQNGEDYLKPNGERVQNEWVTLPNPPGRSYAYCADTLYRPELAEKVKAVHLLYHETTYLHQLAERAASRYHSTTQQAASLARLAGAGRLLIGHFSSKYEFLEPFLEETRQVFPNTELALEGVTYRV